MATKQYPIIAREGWSRLALIFSVALGLNLTLGVGAAAPAWLFLLFMLYLFRDPTRLPPPLPLAIVSPIHGKVLEVGERNDPWLKRDSMAIEVKGGFFDIRSIYSPTEGKIVEQWRHAVDSSNDGDRPNEAIAYWIQTDEMDDVVLEIRRGEWRGPLSFRNNPGERLGHGRRVGYVNNGCYARVYLPPNTLAKVSPGEKIRAAQGVIAEFVHLTEMAKPRPE